jgi:hypothetical protein
MEKAPDIILLIALVLGINGVQLSRGARRGEKWAFEEGGKTF